MRDQFGRYYCRPCARRALRPNAPNLLEETDISGLSQSIDQSDFLPSLIEEVRRSAMEGEPPEPTAPPPAEPHPQTDDGSVALADDSAVPQPDGSTVALVAESAALASQPDDQIIPLAPEDTRDDEQLKTCPVCFHRFPPRVGVCANCGFDEKIGISSSRFIEASRQPPKGHSASHKPFACPDCGYDMSRAASLQCPECGHIMPTRAHVMRQELAKQTEYEAYHTPAVYLALGLVGALIVGLATMGWPIVVILPSVFILQVAVGLLVTYACMFFWIGFDAPFNLNLLRLSAVYAGSICAALLATTLLGWGIPAFSVFVLAFLILNLHLLDFDFVDAAAVAILNMIVAIAGYAILPGFIALFA
ncbi:MAG: hypothetical protein DYG94_00495 [Leptolyngbya sp. PLA3]|nr:MAG: hypothetical protein EDM82_01380 [Cyanobacteria bacterium CYA]MCE7967214.1 hypothetical protein [Leptolyngbya sp. PL-A3]